MAFASQHVVTKEAFLDALIEFQPDIVLSGGFLESALQGVKYQVGIALAFLLRLWSVTAYRCANSERKKWLSIFTAEGCLIVALVAFALYAYASYRVFASQTACAECFPPTLHLLGATQIWGSVLTIVILIETIYGVARLTLPTIDLIQAKRL